MSQNIIDSFRGEYAFLSNFYLAPIELWGIQFPSSEHAYQWAKTNDPAEKNDILFNKSNFAGETPTTPGQAKRKGKKVTKRSDWNEISLEIMEKVVVAKFTDHPDLAKKLKNTNDDILIESNDWHDNFYGDCYCSDCKKIPGLNHLGQILMRVRKEIIVGLGIAIEPEV